VTTTLTRSILLIGFLAAASAASPARAESPKAEFKFSGYTADTEGRRAGHWLEFQVDLPAGMPLADRSVVFYDLYNYFKLVNSAALAAEPEALSKALDLKVPGADHRQLAVDIMLFNSPELLLQTLEVFEEAAEQGHLELPSARRIKYREFLPATLTRATPRQGPADPERSLMVNPPEGPLMVGPMGQAEAKELRDVLEWAARRSQADPDKLLRLNSRNVIAGLMSYRSEMGELPPDLQTLQESNHLLVPLHTPETPSAAAPGTVRERGSLYYERTAINVGLMVLTFSDGRVDREILEDQAPKPGISPGILAEQREDYTPEDLQVRRYVFQIGMLLKVFYHERGYLPSTVAHLELLGFAEFRFPNAFEPHRTARSLPDLSKPSPGDYYYYRVSPNEFILVGFGTDGKRILTMRPSLPAR